MVLATCILRRRVNRLLSDRSINIIICPINNNQVCASSIEFQGQSFTYDDRLGIRRNDNNVCVLDKVTGIRVNKCHRQVVFQYRCTPHEQTSPQCSSGTVRRQCTHICSGIKHIRNSNAQFWFGLKRLANSSNMSKTRRSAQKSV